MIKWFSVWLAACIGLFAAQPALANQATDLAETVAQALQAMVGEEFEGGLKITVVRAEGEVLVFVMDGPEGWRGTLNAKSLGNAFAGGFCEEGPQFFESGMKMRFDTTEAGGKKLIAGETINSCPET